MIDLDLNRARKKERSAAEEAYDDSKDHERCPDCKGSGFYVGLRERSYCKLCDGSGWL